MPGTFWGSAAIGAIVCFFAWLGWKGFPWRVRPWWNKVLIIVGILLVIVGLTLEFKFDEIYDAILEAKYGGDMI